MREETAVGQVEHPQWHKLSKAINHRRLPVVATEIEENPAGHSISDVIISWGAPNLTAEIEGKGKVYIWIACDTYNQCCNQNMVTDSNGIVVDYTESGSCR